MAIIRNFGSAAFALVALLWGHGAANAQNQQDYCIKCSNPDETYICRIISNSAQSQGQQFLCIMNIAREQGHDSCAATTQSQSCSGVLVQYDLAGLMPQGMPPARAPVTNEPGPYPDASPPRKKEPETLVEFTKQTTKATKKGFQKIGSNTSKAFKKTGKKITKFSKNVGNGIKKTGKTTWNCLTSLFFNCKGN